MYLSVRLSVCLCPVSKTLNQHWSFYILRITTKTMNLVMQKLLNSNLYCVCTVLTFMRLDGIPRKVAKLVTKFSPKNSSTVTGGKLKRNVFAWRPIHTNHKRKQKRKRSKKTLQISNKFFAFVSVFVWCVWTLNNVLLVIPKRKRTALTKWISTFLLKHLKHDGYIVLHITLPIKGIQTPIPIQVQIPVVTWSGNISFPCLLVLFNT